MSQKNIIEESFWKGKKVLITGHTGFKGSWLSLWLQLLGADLVGLSLDPPTKPSLYEQANVAAGMLSLRADIRDFKKVNEIFQTYKPEVVFHLAAQSLVRYSYISPMETYQTNVMGTMHILEAIRNSSSVKVVVMVTSDKCYENREWDRGYRESDSMGGYDPYSSSKGCAELIVASYRSSFLQDKDVGLATVRAGNVIGGGDWADDRLIPDILRSFESGEPVLIRNPHATRPWQHVLEPLSGYLLLAQKLFDNKEYAEGWNFGPKEQDIKPVESILKKMILNLPGFSWELNPNTSPHEANILKLDISKAQSKLGWSPEWALNKSLDKIIDWHKAWIDKEDMQLRCVTEIKEYMKDMQNKNHL
jgi:CDP-glucose 4,6-dehydratase